MPGTTTNNGLRYPLATEAPDGPGAFLALATDVDNSLTTAGTWTPTIGGTAATLGTGGSSDGRHSRVGKHVSAKGRLIFGTGGSFGSGVATVSGLPVTISTSWSTGYGMFLAPGGGSVIPVMLTPVDGANLAIRPIKSNGTSNSFLGVGFDIGTPASGAILLFTLDLTS